MLLNTFALLLVSLLVNYDLLKRGKWRAGTLVNALKMAKIRSSLHTGLSVCLKIDLNLLKIWCNAYLNFYVQVPVACFWSLVLTFFKHFVCLFFFYYFLLFFQSKFWVVIDWGPGPAPVRDYNFSGAPAAARAMKKFCQGLGWKIHKNSLSERTKSDIFSRFSLMHIWFKTTLF